VAQYTPIGRRRAPAHDGRVYAILDDLVRLQFQASGFSFLPRQPIHSLLAGRHASRLRGRGLNFEELRNYLPGDDIRTIDWKVTARTDAPHVRVYTEERDRPVWLVVDQRQSMFFGSRWKMKSVAAAEAAAVAAWRVLAAGDRVGAMVFDDTDIVTIPPHRSRERVMRILRAVVDRNHALRADRDLQPGPHMINEVLRRLGPLARHDNLVVLITDGFGVDESSRPAATGLTEHNDMLGLVIFDPLERRLDDAGRLDFSDGARLLEVDTGRARVRGAYEADFEARMQTLHTLSRRNAVPLLTLDASLPLLEQVRHQLGYEPHAGDRR
jgi:uncharacterized protein (DUF58 family)